MSEEVHQSVRFPSVLYPLITPLLVIAAKVAKDSN